jgi:hypothetical protein
MAEMHERLREFIDTGAEPVTMEEILLTGSSSAVTSPAKPPGPRSRRRVLVGVGAVVLIAALVTIALNVVPSGQKLEVQKASAATVLKSAAKAARNQPPLIPEPARYLYVAILDSGTYGESDPPLRQMFQYFADSLVQTWTSPRATGSQRWVVVGRPQFVTGRDRTIWVSDGSKPFGSGSESGRVTAYYNVADLPTVPSAMKAYFATQPYLQSSAPFGRNASFQIDSALQFLQNGASSLQRAALLKYIATLPGVSLIGDATSIATNEKGAVIAMKTDRSGLTEEAIINPTTSNLIEIRFVVSNPKTFHLFPPPAPQFTYVKGEVLSYTDDLFAGIASLGKAPAHSPELPRVWPFGALRVPLPGSVTP